MKASFRILYRQLLVIISCCLLVTALTGIIVGVNNRLIQLPNFIVKILLDLHQGRFLGDKLASIYVLLLGLGVFCLGLKIVASKYDRLLFGSVVPVVADAFRIIGLILVIPLAVCVETGLAYRLGTDWLGMSGTETTKFLSVHGGYFLAKPWDTIYLLAVGIALLALLILSQKSNKIARQQIRNADLQQPKQTLFPDFSFKNNGVFAKKIKLAIGAAIALFALYYFTSGSIVGIAAIIAIVILFVIVLSKNIIKSWRQPKQASTILQDREAESITMLRAIPDSMLCVSQNGICLSYMPAQEATSFTLYGDIVNKHIDEFLAPKIARQFTTLIKSSLQTGSTNDCSFSISGEDEEQHFEARVNPIGQTEVLILVREIHNSNFGSGIAQHSVLGDNKTIPVFTESEFTQVLEKKLPNSNEKNFILLCLTIYLKTENTIVSATDNTDVVTIDSNLISQIIATVHSLIPSSIIARFDDNDLIILVGDRTIETSSTMIDELHQKINELLFSWQNDFSSIDFKIALLEINSDISDVKASINAAKTACQMAKQKINLKTF